MAVRSRLNVAFGPFDADISFVAVGQRRDFAQLLFVKQFTFGAEALALSATDLRVAAAHVSPM